MPIVLTEKNYKQYVGNHMTTIIDFSATWCGPCKKMEPYYHQAEHDLRDAFINFTTVDVDDEEGLAEKYKVTSMPTLVFIQNGVEVGRHTNSEKKEKILALIKEFFNISP
jgi:thioredoxin 1